MTTDTGLIEGLAPTNHATSEDTYGLATSDEYGDKYGHVKLQAGDLSDTSYNDGVAASAAHNHDGKYAER